MAQLQNWLKQESFPAQFKKIWLAVLAEASDIRRSSGIEQKATNIAQVVLSDLQQKLAYKQPKEILMVGTGKIAELFTQQKPDDVILHFAARKRFLKAKQLAQQSGGQAIFFEAIGERIEQIDAVVSATASPHYVIKKSTVLPAIRQRQNPLYMYDLAVPRDIEPDLAAVPTVVLRDLDSLSELLMGYNQALQPYCQSVETLIETSLSRIEGAINVYNHYSRHAAVTTCAQAG